MILCDHLTLRVLLISKVFVPHRWKRVDCWDVAAKSIVKSKAPTKVCFFAWAASKGNISTKDKLKRRNF